MSWIRVWIHVVFTTKKRKPFLNNKEVREKVFAHIKQNAKKKGIKLDEINGYKDHVHCLIAVNKDLSISETIRLIKGESSFWINKNAIVNSKFSWQDDYWAVSVSESHLPRVKAYIQNQEEHHKKKSFEEEVEQFMKKYGWRRIDK